MGAGTPLCPEYYGKHGAQPFFMALWERLLGNLVLTDDLVLNTVFAGFGIGISLGITIRAGASTGGMDIPPLVLNKWFHLPVSST